MGEVLHVMPSIKTLDLTFIGPQVTRHQAAEKCGEAISIEACARCRAVGRTKTCTYYEITYHEYAQQAREKGETKKATLAVAFNPGMSQVSVEGWLLTCQALSAEDVPAVFTSYSQYESRADCRLWEQAGGLVTRQPQLNPYGVLEPLLSPGSVDNTFYKPLTTLSVQALATCAYQTIWKPHTSLSAVLDAVLGHASQPLPAQQKQQACKHSCPQLLQLELCSSKLVVALDLDETLVTCYSLSDLPAWLHQCRDSLQTFVLKLPFGTGVRDCASAKSKGTKKAQAIQVQQVLVVLRPGVHEFMRRLSAVAELVLFTAAMPEYALPIITQLLDPDGSLFQRRYLFRQQTTMFRHPSTHSQSTSTKPSSHSVHCLKDLTLLRYDLSRVVMVDNNPVSCLLQPCNGIPCQPFRGDPADNQLSTVLLPLLQSLALFADVRPILTARFKLGEWLASKGFPVPSEEVTHHPTQLQPLAC